MRQSKLRRLRQILTLAAATGAVMALPMVTAPTYFGKALAAEDAFLIPPPTNDIAATAGSKTIVLAGGCFWGVQGVYQHTDGVINAVSGYAGDGAATANYDSVSNGKTKHAEAVEVTYDPQKVTLGKLLQIYFSVVHDPTQLNRQGPDVGAHYRSTIFTSVPAERQLAEGYIAQLQSTGVYKGKIVTTLEPLQKFYAAEQYHQDYLTNHPRQPYIVFNDLPKIANLKKMFGSQYREQPVLVGTLKTSTQTTN